jgi:hypothetical protein
MSDCDTKFKEDHLVLPVAAPLPHHASAAATHNSIKSGYQHDVLNSASSVGGGLHDQNQQDKYMEHLANHNRFLMPTSMASDQMKASEMSHHFSAAAASAAATNPFSIHRFLPGGNLTDPKDVVSHYDYSHLGAPGVGPGPGQGQFSHHESMYYPPPLYPVHPTSSSVHSNHL